MQNLKELPRFRDGLSYLYLEHGRIDQHERAVAWYSEQGMVHVPAASLGVLLLGPGTSVTHAAVKALAANGCTVCWVGEEGVRFYGSGIGETRSASNLHRQASAWADDLKRAIVVRRMYQMRFPHPLADELSIEQIRGMEGVRVREAYARASQETGVEWKGRSYKRDDWRTADPINRALSAASSCLYGLSHAGIVSAGYSPALGFIHTGKQLSFVYDIADLYKADTTVPAAFRAVAESQLDVERRLRLHLRDRFRETRLLERVVADLHSLFEGVNEEDPFADDGARPGELWDPGGTVEGGKSYGGDDS